MEDERMSKDIQPVRWGTRILNQVSRLATFCCITNYYKTSWLESTHVYYLPVSVAQKSGSAFGRWLWPRISQQTSVKVPPGLQCSQGSCGWDYFQVCTTRCLSGFRRSVPKFTIVASVFPWNEWSKRKWEVASTAEDAVF